jgi:oligoribonuclease (3'-5' exoribonuclease)
VTSNPYVLWLDLETTGTEEHAQIIEVGMVLTEGITGPLKATYSQVFHSDVPVGTIDPVVISMHEQNGLWREVYESKITAPQCERDMLEWLGGAGALKGPLPLAGSGVSHFDRRFIRRYWPKLDKKLAYAMYDVGVLRRFLRDWGMLPSGHGDGKPKDHRALADAMMHYREAQVLRDHVTS